MLTTNVCTPLFRLQNGDDQLPGKLNARSAFVDFDDYAETDAEDEFDPELEFLGDERNTAARAEQAGSHFRPRKVSLWTRVDDLMKVIGPIRPSSFRGQL